VSDVLFEELVFSRYTERFCSGDSLRRGAISSVCTFSFFTFTPKWCIPYFEAYSCKYGCCILALFWM